MVNEVQSGKQEKFKLFSVAELVGLTAPEWLIDGVIQGGALAVLYGPSGSGKSFLALDCALSIAANKPWHGRSVAAGQVVYVVGEGTTGIGKRLAAWMEEHDTADIPGAFFVIEAPQMADDGDLSALLSAIEGHHALKEDKPRLVVLDTLACCFVGKDENSAGDMGQFVAGCRRLQKQSDTAVLVVHHSGKSGESERGSGALRAAADVMLTIAKKGPGRLTLRNDKQKDAEAFKPMVFSLHAITIENGTAGSSCVLRDVPSEPTHAGTALGAGPQSALAALAPLGQAASGAWRKAMGQPAPKSFDNWRVKLVNLGLVEPIDGIAHHYRITQAGKSALSQTSEGLTEAAA